MINGLPKISVIMPVFNNEKYLAEAIESILKQSFTDFEFIIIDDGSNDQSLEIIRAYAKKDERIKIILNEKNKGIFISRNLGLEASQGEYIAVMDSDDISMPERFKMQVAFLDGHSDIDVLGGQILEIDSEFNLKRKSAFPLTPGLIRWGLIFGCQLAHPVAMMRQKIIKEHRIRYVPSQVAADYALWIKISTISKIANLSQVLLYYRKHEGNISKKKSQLQRQETHNIIKRYILDITGKNYSDNVIQGVIAAKHLKIHKNIDNIRDAQSLSRLMINLLNHALQWDLTNEDRYIVKQQTASRLRAIWKTHKFNIILLPYVIYSIFLDPDIINRKIKFRISIGK